MATTNPTILLVAASPTGVSSLVSRFTRWSCETHFASSTAEAIALVRERPFDLLLSEFKFREGSSSPLTVSLLGSTATLIYSYPVKTGCWWLPAVQNGVLCWGSPAMRPGEFIHFLEDFLTVIRLRKTLASDECSEQSFLLTPEVAVAENRQTRRRESARAAERGADAA